MVVRMGLLTLPALHTARPPLLSPTYVSLCPSVPCWVQERYRGTACSSRRYHKSYSKLNRNNNNTNNWNRNNNNNINSDCNDNYSRLRSEPMMIYCLILSGLRGTRLRGTRFAVPASSVESP